MTPSPRPLKGPVISAGTSRCFCAGLRANELELNRARTSLNGSTTGSESYSSSTLNRAGRGLAQFAEGDFNDAQRQLRHDFSN